MDVIGFVAGHHLVARDAVQHRVYDGPLRSGFPPTALGFRFGQVDDCSHSQVAVQFAAHDKDTAPDYASGF